MAKSAMIDSDTGGPVTKDTINAVSRDEYSRMLLQGPALRELAKRDAYLNANPAKERSWDDRIYEQTDPAGRRGIWLDRKPTLTTFGPNPGAMRFYNRYGAADGLMSPDAIIAQIRELQKVPSEENRQRLFMLRDALSNLYGINDVK